MRVQDPIGVFDSGFGGLSVLHAIRERLPAEDLLYCADHAYWPYGERDTAAIRARALAVGRALAAAPCKALVIACNTATAAAAETLRGELSIPVIGMEPAVKPAAAATRNGVVGVLGTGGTLASARFSGLLDRHAGTVRVVTRPCPELVDAVERGAPDAPGVAGLVEAAVTPLVDAGADVLVLGCTHFPMLRDAIERAAGPGVTVIDTGPAVARELERRLAEAGLVRAAGAPARARFCTTAAPADHAPGLRRLWGDAALARLELAEPAAATRD